MITRRDVFYQLCRNVGDSLTPDLLRHFLPEMSIRRAQTTDESKMLCVGSNLRYTRPGDTVWGTGAMYGNEIIERAETCDFLAVRGPLTRDVIRGSGGDCPEVYGDPALLLPILYHPKLKRKTKLGYVPHHVDRPHFEDVPKHGRNVTVISVGLHWRKFVERILECERIVSSSLHGIIIAEAYGIPAEWAEYSDKVLGSGFKFRDYLAGTGREIQGPGKFPPIENLPEIQSALVDALLSIDQSAR